MKTKIIPFNLELAKKIQYGEVEGKIVTQVNEPVRIVCFDKKSTNKRETYQVVALVEINGRECLIICGENGLCWDCEDDCNRSLHIELPEEETEIIENGDYVEIINDNLLGGVQGTAEIYNNTKFMCGVNQGKLGTVCVYDRSKLKILKKYNKEAPKHEFKPFDKVLVKYDKEGAKWFPTILSQVINGLYVNVADKVFKECIPYAGNEHLVGTTINPE